jgi:hypothetical protein
MTDEASTTVNPLAAEITTVGQILQMPTSRLAKMQMLDDLIKAKASGINIAASLIYEAQVAARFLTVQELQGKPDLSQPTWLPGTKPPFEQTPPDETTAEKVPPPVYPFWKPAVDSIDPKTCAVYLVSGMVVTTPDGTTLSALNSVATAYKHHIQRLNSGLPVPLRCVVLLKGDGGHVRLSSGYNANNDDTISAPNAGNICLHVIGVEEGGVFPRLGLGGLGDKFGFVAEFSTVGLDTYGFNDDSFIQRQYARAGHIVRINCAFVPGHPKSAENIYTTGIHFSHGFDSLCWESERYIGAKFREHLMYIESAEEAQGIWIRHGELLGGNRCGFQIRSHAGIPGDEEALPVNGPIVIDGNKSKDHGWMHENADGGAVITVWSNPNHPTWIINNIIEDSRYGGIVLSDQAANRNWLNANGFPIATVHMYGNTVTGSVRADVTVAGVEELVLGSNNIGTLEINTEWSHTGAAGIDVGSVVGEVPAGTLTYDAAQGKYVKWIS